MRKSVVLSIKDPETALEKLLMERTRRTKYLWTRKDGTQIELSKMPDVHLENTIRMLQGKVSERAMFKDVQDGFPDGWSEETEDCE